MLAHSLPCRALLAVVISEHSALLESGQRLDPLYGDPWHESYKDKPARSFAARSASPPPLLVCVLGSVGASALALLVWAMATFASGSHARAAFAMSFGAGMATGVGAALVLCTRSLNRTLLACTLSFSAGVMVYVSLVEVVGVSQEYWAKSQPPQRAYAYATASFFTGEPLLPPLAPPSMPSQWLAVDAP